jgi:hypothetical protein
MSEIVPITADVVVDCMFSSCHLQALSHLSLITNPQDRCYQHPQLTDEEIEAGRGCPLLKISQLEKLGHWDLH